MEMIEKLNAMITGALGPMGPLLLVGGLGLVMIVLALPVMLKRQKDPFAKIKEQAKARERAAAGTALRRAEKADKLEKFAGFLEPQDEGQLSASRLKMLRAGYKSKSAVRMFHFAQLVFGLGSLALGTIYALVLSANGDVTTQMMVLCTIGPGAAGYYLPIYWVNKRVKEREGQIVSGFPDALDLMLVCVEAGQSLDQSIARVAKETKAGYPALAEEFEAVSQQVKAGRERVAVLKEMAERVGVPDVASFVTTLVQSATFGTSIAEALRVYSSEMRDKRVMRAEEKANVLPTKLTLGTMLFTVPPLMIILIGPSIYGIATQLGGGG
ncbi:type II secretion system F family protein [Aliigemmobacter aestuarii]|uniref:Type II secretion system F family protein n=1 Tax=Aliigemmobacter aestuarii TaxID=1445661 RepID=A0A4S3MJG4_9RHOB|nr:type II secretion system F family protein [Gemmobacter aestuarii]THD81579.1 type II secretion system F family protein [Gemmobacter aestuarii]